MEAVFDFILNLFFSNGLIIAVTAFVIGSIIKKLSVIPNNYIPLIGGTVGLILGLVIPDLFEGKDMITSMCLGLALGWAATGGYESIKSLKGDVKNGN
jgi:hypothetical protein